MWRSSSRLYRTVYSLPSGGCSIEIIFILDARRITRPILQSSCQLLSPCGGAARFLTLSFSLLSRSRCGGRLERLCVREPRPYRRVVIHVGVGMMTRNVQHARDCSYHREALHGINSRSYEGVAETTGERICRALFRCWIIQVRLKGADWIRVPVVFSRCIIFRHWCPIAKHHYPRQALTLCRVFTDLLTLRRRIKPTPLHAILVLILARNQAPTHFSRPLGPLCRTDQNQRNHQVDHVCSPPRKNAKVVPPADENLLRLSAVRPKKDWILDR